MRLFAFFCLAAAHLTLQDIDQTILETAAQLDSVRRAREYLMTRNATAINNPLPVPLAQVDSSWRMHRLIHKWDIVRSTKDTEDSTALQFISLKPLGPYRDITNGMNIGLLVARASGMLELYDLNGNILYKYHLNFTAHHLAATSGYEEIKVLAGSEGKVVLIDLDMGRVTKNLTEVGRETGLQIDYLNITMTEETVLNLEAPLCSLQHYVKLGNKQWVTVDCQGNFQLYTFNGTASKATHLEKPFLKLDRFGQQLSFMTDSYVGHMQVDLFKPFQSCHLHSRIIDMTIDSSFSISQLHVLLESGELYIVDTSADCKKVARHHSHKINSKSKVLSLRGATIVWTGLELLYFEREGEEPQSLSVKGGKGLITSQRVQSGSNFIAIDSATGVRLYEFVAPHKNTAAFDFGNMRFVIVLFVIGLVVLWQVMKKGKDKVKTD